MTEPFSANQLVTGLGWWGLICTLSASSRPRGSANESGGNCASAFSLAMTELGPSNANPRIGKGCRLQQTNSEFGRIRSHEFTASACTLNLAGKRPWVQWYPCFFPWVFAGNWIFIIKGVRITLLINLSTAQLCAFTSSLLLQ